MLIEPDLIERLRHPRAEQRTRAARHLRAGDTPGAGPPLLEALRKEVQHNSQGWKTQYHLIMALLATGHRAALPVLKEMLMSGPRLKPMARVAAADASIGLDKDPVDRFMELTFDDDPHVRTGAFRAAARQRLTLSEAQAVSAITAVPRSPSMPEQDSAYLYCVIASAGWPDAARAELLEAASYSPWAQLREAATAAKNGQYADVPIL